MTTAQQPGGSGMCEDDAALIKNYLRGDQEAFQYLYERYRKPLYGYLNRLLDNSALVDDLYQKTWMKVISNLQKYRENQKFSAWLFRIAHNTAMDHFRARRTAGQFSFDESVEPEALADARDNPIQNMDRAELVASVKSALPNLPVAQREVFLLRQEGVSFREIAAIQGVSINTVLGRMRYALQKLRQLLSEWQEHKELI